MRPRPEGHGVTGGGVTGGDVTGCARLVTSGDLIKLQTRSWADIVKAFYDFQQFGIFVELCRAIF